MFYTRTKTEDGTDRLTRITADNTVTFCFSCGKAMKMDLAKLHLAKFRDPYNPPVLCSKCAAKMLRGMHVTSDALLELTDVLRDMGFHGALAATCGKFNVESVYDLEPESYVPFVDALLDSVHATRSARHG